MAKDHQAYLQALEKDYERPQLIRSLMPRSPSAALSVTIGLAAGQLNPVNAGPINLAVTFSKPVTGFVNADISFVGSSVGGTLAAAVTGGPSTYNVAVTGMTGNGLVAVSVIPGAAVDATGNLTPGSIAAFVTLVTTSPSVTINKEASQADPAGTGPINFTVIFSSTVMGFTASDVSFTGSTAGGTLAAAVSGSGPVYNVAVTGMTTAGNVVASVPAGAAIDLSGNLSAASTSTDNVVAFAPTGFPDASNTGPTPGTVFTPFSGQFVTTANGQTVQGLNVTGSISVRHTNVTVQNCIINGNDFYGISTQGASLTGLKILNCKIIGQGAQACITPDNAPACEIAFCDLSHMTNGIFVGDNNQNFHDNYIHDLSSSDATPHVDGIQGSGGFTSLTINHNTIISWDTSCIILQNEGAGFSGAVITNNKLIIDPTLGGAYCILCQKRDDAAGLVSNITVTGNRMNKGSTVGASYGFFHNVTALTWNTNVDDVSSAPINPDIG